MLAEWENLFALLFSNGSKRLDLGLVQNIALDSRPSLTARRAVDWSTYSAGLQGPWPSHRAVQVSQGLCCATGDLGVCFGNCLPAREWGQGNQAARLQWPRQCNAVGRKAAQHCTDSEQNFSGQVTKPKWTNFGFSNVKYSISSDTKCNGVHK